MNFTQNVTILNLATHPCNWLKQDRLPGPNIRLQTEQILDLDTRVRPRPAPLILRPRPKPVEYTVVEHPPNYLRVHSLSPASVAALRGRKRQKESIRAEAMGMFHSLNSSVLANSWWLILLSKIWSLSNLVKPIQNFLKIYGFQICSYFFSHFIW